MAVEARDLLRLCRRLGWTPHDAGRLGIEQAALLLALNGHNG